MTEPAESGAAPRRAETARVPALALFAAIVVSGLLLRLPGLSTPITGIRETQSAMIARNILRDGPSGVLRPRVDYGGDKPGHFALEFPLTGALGALVWRCAPSLGDASLKVPSLAFYVLGAAFLFDLARRRAGARIALFASALYALYPLHAEMSVSPMPDETGLALGTAAIALLDRHLAGGGAATLLLSFACASLALLAKSTYFYLAVPLVYLVVRARGWREIFFRPKWIVLAAAAVLPLVLWLLHAKGLNAASELWIGRTVDDTNATYASQRGRLAYYLSLAWYARLASRCAALLTLAGTILFLAGLVLARWSSGLRGLVLAWAASIVLYCLVLPHHVHSHHYYLLPAAPLAAIAGALAIDSLRRFVRSDALATALGLLLLVPVAVEGIPAAVAGERAVREGRVEFGEAARRIVPVGDLLVVSAWVLKSFDGALLYQADRKGFKFTAHTIDEDDPEDLAELASSRRRRGVLIQGRRHVPPSVSAREALTPERLEELRGRGARFFAYFGPPAQWVEEQRDLARHVLSRYPAVETDGRWIFVDLRRALDPAEDFAPPLFSGGSDGGATGFTLAGVAPSPDPDRFPGEILLWTRDDSGDGRAFGGLVPKAAFEPGAMALEWRPARAEGR